MKTTLLKYHVIIQKEGSDYIAYVPTLGISDFGKTVSQAKQNVAKAIVCHIEGLVKTKTEVPLFHFTQKTFQLGHSAVLFANRNYQ